MTMPQAYLACFLRDSRQVSLGADKCHLAGLNMTKSVHIEVRDSTTSTPQRDSHARGAETLNGLTVLSFVSNVELLADVNPQYQRR